MRPGRRKAIAAGVAGGVLGAGALGAWVAIPGVIRDEAITRIERRTGLRCTIAEVGVGLSQVVLDRVALRDEGGAIEANLGSVTLDAGPLALAGAGLAAVRTVTVRGGDVRIDAGGDALGAWLARVRGGASEERPGEAGGSGPRIVVEELAASVGDEHGELARVAEIALRIDGDHASFDAHDLGLAEGRNGSMRIDSMHIEGSTATRRAAALRAFGVHLEIADSTVESPGVLARSLAALARLRAGAQATPEIDRAAGSPGTGRTDRAAGSPGTGRTDRAASAPGTAGTLVEERDAGSVAATGQGDSFDSLGWLEETFRAEIEGLSIRRATPEGARDVLTGLEFTVERTGLGTLRTRGQGTPDGGGELAWDLLLEPTALRAEGSIDLEQVALAVLEPLLAARLPLHRPEDARLAGSLRIEGHGETLAANGRLAIRDLALFHPRLAPEPIRGIALGLEGRATFLPAQRRLELAWLRVESGQAHADFTGTIEWAPEHYLFELEATLPPTRCNDAIGAIPRDLLQDLVALSLSGMIGGRIRARIDSRDLDGTELVIRVADGCHFDLVPPMADLSRFERPFMHRVEEPDGSIFEMESGPGSASWVSITAISPFFVHAALGHEDAAFWSHEGFSTWAIREATVRNLRAGRYVMGASTITMQLVKNVFLRREKTLARKVQEVLLTWWLESAWPKERILELYLNVIEYGPGVYGIRNAARHYFGVEPAALSPAQAAYLANVLPSPKRYHGHYEAGTVPPSFVHRVTRFLRLMGERGRFDAAAVEEGISEIGTLRFHREGDPPPAPRTWTGRTAPLPFVPMGVVEAQWDSIDGYDEGDADPDGGDEEGDE